MNVRTPSTRPTTRRAAIALLAAVVVLAAGCGGDGATDTAASPEVEVTVSSTTGTTPAEPAVDSTSPTVATDVGALDVGAPDLGDVVALGEEFVLADLLALGVTPIASTATVDTAGFQGLDGFDTTGIEVLPQTTLSLEYLASLQPDTIVALQFFVDQVGADVLEGIADVVVVPDGLSGSEQLEAIGDLIGRPERADAVALELDAAATAAGEAIGDDCVLSLASVYPGPTVAAFVDGPSSIPAALQRVGCQLVPGPDVTAPDANGRAWLSEEQYGLLGQDLLVLMQNDTVDGESDALRAIESSPLWSTLPAVQADNVRVIDRLGYPGTPGLIRLYGELPTIVRR
jgi:ABC-type Fe3+-hydroxamate transport system substrate-binding protein